MCNIYSGRVRQNATDGTAVIRVLSNDIEIAVLRNPDNLTLAWQWVSTHYNFEDTVATPRNLTIQMELVAGNEHGRAYFDDVMLCITLEPGKSNLDSTIHIFNFNFQSRQD